MGTGAERARGTITEPAFRLFRKRDGISFALDVRPMQDALVGGVRDSIVMLGWAVATVLVMACVNLAALLLARGGSRTKEIATRMALGSGRRAIVRQLMVEALLLAMAGGALGMFVGWVGLEALKSIGGQTFEEWTRVTLDGRVLLVSLGLSLITSLLFGLVPAWQASRVNVQASLADGGSRSIAGSSKHWLRRSLVVAQVALGVAMLVAAGLLLRTFMNLRNLDPGFEPRGLVTASVSMQDSRYRTAESINRLFEESLRRVRATAGVESAAISLELPYERLLNRSFRFPEMAAGDSLMTNSAYITPGFLATLRLPLRAGRDLTETDTAAGPRVVLINETFARIYSRDQSPIGRRLRIAGEEREIVGVTGDVQQRRSLSIDGIAPGPLTSLPIVFVPAAQTADGDFRGVHTWFEPVWSVRARTQADGARAIREAIRAVDPLLPLSGQHAMTDVMAAAMSQQRLLVTLVGVLAGAALLLAAIGIYGLLAHSIGERRREFGIRMALGATPAETVRGVAMSGIALAAAGAVARCPALGAGRAPCPSVARRCGRTRSADLRWGDRLPAGRRRDRQRDPGAPDSEAGSGIDTSELTDITCHRDYMARGPDHALRTRDRQTARSVSKITGVLHLHARAATVGVGCSVASVPFSVSSMFCRELLVWSFA